MMSLGCALFWRGAAPRLDETGAGIGTAVRGLQLRTSDG